MNIDLLLLKRFNLYFQCLQTFKKLPLIRAERSKNEMEKQTN